MDSFLPSGYEVPSAQTGYMRLEQGDNAFRILASPILGYEWWIDTDDGKRKPIRVKMGDTVPVEFADSVKHFWAMPVWNRKAQKIQILEITQKGIMQPIKALASNPKWGHPTKYDIVVNRTGEGLETAYSVISEPPSPLEEEIQVHVDDVLPTIRLEALYDGEDPFSPSASESVLSEKDLETIEKVLS